MDRIEIINNWNLSRVFQELEQGNMRIPRFQRSYVWERSKIVKLLNSIYHEFPIGSFFLWEADTAMEGFCRDITEFGFPDKPAGNRFSFILDGQQRITSLYVALRGKTLQGTDYRVICFNLDKKVFKIPTLKTEPNNIPAWKLFDQGEFQNLLIEYAASGERDKAQTLSEVKTIFDNYPVSIIFSKNMSLDEVVTIFERINQGGKRLSLFDLVHASVWSQDFDLRDKISEFNDEPAIKLWGRIDNEIFTQSLALNTSNDCVKTHQLGLKNEDCKNAWTRTTECIRLAVDFLKNQWGVQGVEIIPYQNIIPVLQYYFYITNESTVLPEHKQALTDWFWTLTFSNRYSSSTLTKMTNDARWIKRLVQDSSATRVFTVKLMLDDLRKIRMGNRSVIKNGVLCLMARRKPVDFDNGNLVTLDKTNASRQNSKENHHFFPYSLASKMGIKQEEINSLLNFAFISKHLNLDISNKYPSHYLQEYASANSALAEHLLSHFITQAAYQAALQDDFQTFIKERGNAILTAINNVCRVDDGIQTMSSNVDESEDEIELEDSFDDVDKNVRTEPWTWLIPSYNKVFDLPACFEKTGHVYWLQFNNFLAGDTAYIYSSRPESAISFKVEIVGADMPYDPIMDERREFFKDPKDHDDTILHNRYAEFRLLEVTSATGLKLEDLLQHGLNGAPRSPLNLSHPGYAELLKYIEDRFTSISLESYMASRRVVEVDSRRIQLDFWTKFRDKLQGTGKIPSLQTPQPQYWYDVRIGRSGIGLSNVCNTQKNFVGVRVYISNKVVNTYFPQLLARKDEINAALGSQPNWDPNPEAKDKTITLLHQTDLSDSVKVEEALDWLVNQTIIFHAVFSKEVKDISI